MARSPLLVAYALAYLSSIEVQALSTEYLFSSLRELSISSTLTRKTWRCHNCHNYRYQGESTLPFFNVISSSRLNASKQDKLTPVINDLEVTSQAQETEKAESKTELCKSAKNPSGTEGLTTDQIFKSQRRNDETIISFLPILFLCFFVAIHSALDRVAMSVAILPLSTEYHLSETLKGEVSSVSSLGYGLGIIPCGLLVATASPRLLMAVGVGMWSLATFGTPVAASLITVIEQHRQIEVLGIDAGVAEASVTYLTQNLTPLLLTRALMGASESVVLPAIQRLLSNWVPASQKSLAIAGIFSGFHAGTICAYLFSPTVIENFGGWRGMFYLYGGLGVLWLVPWLSFAKDAPPSSTVALDDGIDGNGVCYNDKKVNKKVRNSEIDSFAVSKFAAQYYAGSETEDQTSQHQDKTSSGIANIELSLLSAYDKSLGILKSAPWSFFLKSRATWGMTIAHAANNWGLYNSLSWTPTFYAEQYNLNIHDSALLSLLPSVAGAVGGLFAGSLADAVLRRIGNKDDNGNEETKTLVRKIFQGIALLGPAACLLVLAHDIPDMPLAAQALLTGSVGLQAFNAAGFGASTQEKAGEKWSGLLYSLTSLPGVLVGSAGVYVTGQILDMNGRDWSSVFALNAGIDIIGALAFICLYNSKQEFE